MCVLTSTRSLSDHAEIAAASGAGLAAAVYGRDADAIRRCAQHRGCRGRGGQPAVHGPRSACSVWRLGQLWRELLRTGSRRAPVLSEVADRVLAWGGGGGRLPVSPVQPRVARLARVAAG